MKKILLISDNHGVEHLEEIENFEKSDFNFHLGDSQFSYKSKELENFDFKVKGNNDFDKDFPKEISSKVKDIGNIFLTHGHLRGVNLGIEELQSYGIENNINFIAFGHTHVVYIDYIYEKDLLILNPGSSAFSRSEYPNTYLTVEYDKNKYIINLKDISSFKTISITNINRREDNGQIKY